MIVCTVLCVKLVNDAPFNTHKRTQNLSQLFMTMRRNSFMCIYWCNYFSIWQDQERICKCMCVSVFTRKADVPTLAHINKYTKPRGFSTAHKIRLHSHATRSHAFLSYLQCLNTNFCKYKSPCIKLSCCVVFPLPQNPKSKWI